MKPDEFGFETHEEITLDALCLFCRNNDLAIRFGSGTDRHWVSPFGVALREDSGDLVQRLSQCLNFEIFPMDQGKGVCYFVTRQELEEQLRRILN